MNKINKGINITLLSVLITTNVNAETEKFYFGASYLNTEVNLLGAKNDDSGVAVMLGYSLNENLSFEASYVDLGTLELPQFADAGGSIDTDGYSISALGIYPVNNFKFIGKIGYFWGDSEGTLGSIAGPVEYSSDSSEFLLGAGVAYKATDDFEIKIEYNTAQDFKWTSLGINFYF